MNIKTLIINMLLFSSAVLFPHASTAGVGTGKIKQLMVHEGAGGDGIIMFRTEYHVNKPSCSKTGGVAGMY